MTQFRPIGEHHTFYSGDAASKNRNAVAIVVTNEIYQSKNLYPF